MDTLIQEIFYSIMKLNNFRGDCSDISAWKQPLVSIATVHHLVLPIFFYSGIVNLSISFVYVFRKKSLPKNPSSLFLSEHVIHTWPNANVHRYKSHYHLLFTATIPLWSAVHRYKFHANLPQLSCHISAHIGRMTWTTYYFVDWSSQPLRSICLNRNNSTLLALAVCAWNWFRTQRVANWGIRRGT